MQPHPPNPATPASDVDPTGADESRVGAKDAQPSVPLRRCAARSRARSTDATIKTALKIADRSFAVTAFRRLCHSSSGNAAPAREPCAGTASPPISGTLMALLRYVKRSYDDSWTALRRDVLEPLYFPGMPLLDVVRVVLAAYTEALMDERFSLPRRNRAAEDLILAPVDGFFAVDPRWCRSDVDAAYTVEQIYGSMLRKMLSDLRLARVGWCRDAIWPDAQEG